MVFNGLSLEWAWPGPGPAQARSRPSPRPSKILENWKTLIKIRKYWKILGNIGKLKVFQYFLRKILEKLLFLKVFLLWWLGRAHGSTATQSAGNSTKSERHSHTECADCNWSHHARLNPSGTTRSMRH